jgi:hypothetical protein
MIRNFTKYAFTGSLLLVAAFVPAASASSLTTLQDWCTNTNGDTSTWCNAGNPVGVSGGFDYTLGSQTEGAPATAYAGFGTYNDQNTLGTYTATLNPGAGQYVAMYMDYDLNFNYLASGSFSDFASANGVQSVANATSLSYELDDPNTSSIFADFAGGALTNANNVGVYNPDGSCCDASWALGVNLDVAANTQDLVSFTVSASAPSSGFYLQQTSGTDPSQNIYYSVGVTVESTGSSTPEPGTWLLIAGGLAGALMLRKRLARA